MLIRLFWLESNILRSKIMLIIGLVLLEVFVYVTSQSIEVNMTGDWYVDQGPRLECSWKITEQSPSLDIVQQLQSVKIYNNGSELAVYRPEIHGQKIQLFRDVKQSSTLFIVDCESHILGRSAGPGMRMTESVGFCAISKVTSQPPGPSELYECEVSGERPSFRTMKKKLKLEPFVASNGARLEVTEDKAGGTVTLNCSSTGLPIPDLHWKVGDKQISGNRTGKVWNVHHLEWNVWSTLTLSDVEGDLDVICSPQQADLEAPFATYNFSYNKTSNDAYCNGVTRVVAAMFTILTLLLR